MLSREQMDSLVRYHDELRYWNARVNMISHNDEEHIWVKHILHSLMLLKYVSFKPKARVLDVGTGGGLPGLPIKIARPDVKMTLIDSIAKKIKMVSMFAQHTGLKDVDVICTRAERLADDAHYRGYFDVVITRATASAKDIISWTSPLLAKNGCWALMKGGDLSHEIEEARAALPAGQVQVEELLIDCFGVPQFKADEKKVLICRLS
ncbi:MAG: 16S rRNA (guanine(527)-N(7))-methyltransferase RsmG [Ignavibacteria bacterium]|jgi:16S rRNA (guanine527-N7)-methyltransferase|nr:16S rRNA (guanine(527)-N(7))-methyltransferase RsmG [Ignavibacteria bacterium]